MRYSVILVAKVKIEGSSLRQLVEYANDAIQEMENAGTMYGELVSGEVEVLNIWKDGVETDELF